MVVPLRVRMPSWAVLVPVVAVIALALSYRRALRPALVGVVAVLLAAAVLAVSGG